MKSLITNRYIRLVLLVIASGLFSIPYMSATHIVGGELRYRCLGGDRYEVHLTFVRECNTGEEPAEDDLPAYVAVYDSDNQLIRTIGRGGILILEEQSRKQVSGRLEGVCREPVNDNICYEEVTLCAFVDLPFRPGGYQLVYQRCCRNATIVNVVDPLNVGITLVAELTEEALQVCNQAAIMSAFPPIYACVDEAFTKTVTASDADGDDLVYRLYTPNSGGTADDPRPVPPSNPPYEKIPWENGFSQEDMMSGDQPFNIDSETGVISGTPGLVGQFVVGVAVEEYRNGVLINTTTREYQINVRECQDLVVGDIDTSSMTACLDQDFTLNEDGDSSLQYAWSPEDLFDDPTAVSPTIRISGPTTISVTVTDSLGCSTDYEIPFDVVDSEEVPAFDYLYDCEGTEVELFADSSLIFEEYTWYWEDSILGRTSQIVFDFPDTGIYDIGLVVLTEEGCEVEIIMPVAVVPFMFDIPTLQTTCAIGDTVFLNPEANPDYAYFWKGEGLDSTNEQMINPWIVLNEDSAVYEVRVTDLRNTKCAEDFEVIVAIDNDIDAGLDSVIQFCPGEAFEVNPEGNPDYQYVWRPGSLFDDSTAINPEVLVFSDTTITVVITDSTGCSISMDIDLQPLELDYEIGFSVDYPCEGSAALLLDTSGGGDSLEWRWQDMIIGTSDSLMYDFGSSGTYDVTLRVYAENGCTYDFIQPVRIEPFDPQIPQMRSTCLQGSSLGLNPDGNPEYIYQWSGPGINEENQNSVNPIVIVQNNVQYSVIVRDPINSCEDTIMVQVRLESMRSLLSVDTASICTDEGSRIIIDGVEVYDSVMWFDPDNLPISGDDITIADSLNKSGYYRVEVIEDSCGYTDSVYIDARPYTYIINPEGPYCENDTVIVVINTEGDRVLEAVECESTDALEVLDITGNQVTVVVRQSGTLVGDLLYDDECVRTFTTEVLEVGGLEELSILASQDTIFDGESATITVEGAPEGSTFNWQPQEYISSGLGTNSITAAPPRTITFTVEVTDQAGCQVTLSKTLYVLDPRCTDESYFIPNAFTPNGDGLNDEWCVKSRFVENTQIEEIESVLLVVYDRWGTEIFKQEGPPQAICWDGTFEGEVLAPDVYGYYARMICIGGMELEDRGNVTILR